MTTGKITIMGMVIEPIQAAVIRAVRLPGIDLTFRNDAANVGASSIMAGAHRAAAES
jgi:hypothetical protein